MRNAFVLSSDDENRLAEIETGFTGSRVSIVFTAAQFELALQALSDAFDGAVQAMQKEPHGADEIQPYADGFNELMRMFLASRTVKASSWRPVQPAVDLPIPDAMRLRDFAALRGLTVARVYYLAGEGRILGAFRSLHSRQWLVYPSAEVVSSNHKPAASGERSLPDAGSAFDFGTSPHGLASSGRSAIDKAYSLPASAKRVPSPSLKAGVSRTAKPKAARPDSPRPGRGSPGKQPANSWLAMLPEAMR